jgi:hypothetical protein
VTRRALLPGFKDDLGTGGGMEVGKEQGTTTVIIIIIIIQLINF